MTRRPPPALFDQTSSELPDRGGPLKGVRVVELTKVWAGPYAGKMLAHLGAEVIKIESRSNLDEMRAYGGVDIDAAPYFLSINQEILSAQINLKTAEGLDLLKSLLTGADIFIDNIRPGALERSGLDYDSLKRIKPDLIQCSIKMWGSEGPLGYQTGYAPCFAALSGLTALVGHDGEAPKGMNIRYGDSTAGALAALACIAALHHRESTGEGQFIDLSAVEAMTSLVGDSLFAANVTGVVPQADGNRHPDMCPHGAYPCADQGWTSIAIANEAEWQALCTVLRAQPLAADERFSSLAARLANRTALEAEIAARTISHDAAELAEKLRKAGVAAYPCMSSLDLTTNAFLWQREAFRMVSDDNAGSRPVIGPSWRMNPDPPLLNNGAPRLGEHNAHVFRTIMGLREDEMNDLIARKVID
ncbi:CaiB/BaiF CoA transferase family protein [Novosphingobium panipatense]|jgi:crotonobetainyl-CoA:carnitine CoA-transferase CaiB-like acyl-CoA transferase|uniref:CaiB/BaiF CoA transferase family protein n=1 Tax=Novosphingobium TaxID=165696 RepID=UPI000CDAB7A9|nr:CaiB/BaiF CoA-transferase family protein [Novosphingobium sp. HII-3]